MTQAVIQLTGKQYIVTQGDTLTVDRLDTQDATITVTDVLLVATGDSVQVGTPVVPKASVVLSVVDHTKGKKIKVFKYKNKTGYRKTHGHRQHQTVVKVESISAK